MAPLPSLPSVITIESMSVRKTIQDYLDDFDDMPTTPGDMCWIPCECLKREPCDICSNYGRILTTIRSPHPEDSVRCL